MKLILLNMCTWRNNDKKDHLPYYFYVTRFI